MTSQIRTGYMLSGEILRVIITLDSHLNWLACTCTHPWLTEVCTRFHPGGHTLDIFTMRGISCWYLRLTQFLGALK